MNSRDLYLALIFGLLMASPGVYANQQKTSCDAVLATTAQSASIPRRGKFSKKVYASDSYNQIVDGQLIGRIDHDKTSRSAATYIELADLKLIVGGSEYYLGNEALDNETLVLIARSVLADSNLTIDISRVDNGQAIVAQRATETRYNVSEPSSTFPDGVEYRDQGYRFRPVEKNGQVIFQLGKIESFSYQYLFTSMYLFL